MRLKWQPVTHLDPVIGLEKVDHYKAECQCGEVHFRDGRGQVVEPAVINLPPDRSEFANSPQGPQPYSGFIEFVKQERAKAEALKVAQAKKPPTQPPRPRRHSARHRGAPGSTSAPAVPPPSAPPPAAPAEAESTDAPADPPAPAASPEP